MGVNNAKHRAARRPQRFDFCGWLHSVVSWIFGTTPVPADNNVSRKATPQPGRAAPRRWSLDDVLLSLAPGVDWTLRDACQHCAIIGAPGSGKTSTTLERILRAFIDPHVGAMGGLICCVKPDEAARVIELIKLCGRERDIVHVRAGGDVRIDLLQSLKSAHVGDEVEDILRVIKVVSELGHKRNLRDNQDRFWESTQDMGLRGAIHMSLLNWGSVTFDDIYRICISAPQSKAQARDPEMRKQLDCLKLIDELDKKKLSPDDRHDFNISRDVFENLIAGLSEKPRAIVETMIIGLCEKMNRGSMRRVFASGATTHDLRLMREGKIFVADFPALHGEVGVLANGVLKFLAQRVIERDSIGARSRPVFIFCDEFPHVAVEYDEHFMSTARSAMASMVIAFQNKPQLSARLDDAGNHEKADSLLANVGSNFFHANLDTVTNEWAANMIGKRLETFHSGSIDLQSVDTVSLLTGFGRSSHGQASFSQAYELFLQASYFAGLPTGAARHAGRVGVVLVQSGRRFGRNRLPYLRLDFQQAR